MNRSPEYRTNSPKRGVGPNIDVGRLSEEIPTILKRLSKGGKDISLTDLAYGDVSEDSAWNNYIRGLNPDEHRYVIGSLRHVMISYPNIRSLTQLRKNPPDLRMILGHNPSRLYFITNAFLGTQSQS